MVLFEFCIIPRTTAAKELWCDDCLCKDGDCASGTPAGIISDGEIMLSPLPRTQYVLMMPFPFTLISPRT